MTMILNMGSVNTTNGEYPEVKTWPKYVTDLTGKVFLDNIELSMADFCMLVKYVMTNTPMNHGDPRRELLDILKTMELE